MIGSRYGGVPDIITKPTLTLQGAFNVANQVAGTVPFDVQAVAGQTAVVLRARNSAGTTLFSIDNSGNLIIAGTATITVNEAVTGNLSLTGTLSVTGTSTLTGAVTTVDGLTVGTSLTVATSTTTSSLAVTNSATVGTNLVVGATTSTQALVVTGAATFFGTASFAGVVTFTGGIFLTDDDYVALGNTAASPDVRLGWNTAQTVDALYLGLSDAQNTFVIAENGDRAFDFAKGAQTNPTLYIQSAAQTAANYISFTHNQTNAVIDVGAGDLVLTIAGANLVPSANDAWALGVSGTAISDLFLAGGGVINWDAGNVTLTEAASALTLTSSAASSGVPTLLTVTGAAHTGITAATEDIGANLNFSATKTWAAGAGPLATQREIVIQAPTYVGNAGGALTMTDAYTFYVTAAPTAGANMTISRPWAAGFSGNIGVGAGTALLPSVSFISDPNTGMYNVGADQIGWAVNGTVELTLNATNLSPGANDGNTLGVSGTAWSDLFLAGGAVIDFGAGDVTITEGTNSLAFAGASSGYTFDAVINSNNATSSSITLQTQTFAAGVDHSAVLINPAWAAEDFEHRAVNITPTQNGANASNFIGARIFMTKATAATTLATMAGVFVAAPTITGTVTTNLGIDVASQTNAGATTSRAIRLEGTAASNAIEFGSTSGAASLLWGNAAEQLTLSNSTAVEGLRFVLSTTNSSIRTVGTGDVQIRLQDQTFTPGAAHEAVVIAPTYAAENFNHYALSIQPTQNGGNTQTVRGLEITMTKATGATVLTNMAAIAINAPSVTGTVTGMSGLFIQDISTAAGSTSYAIDIQAQSANATTTRAILIEGSNVANAIRLGNSPNIYSSAANVIRFSDATDARSLVFTLTAAGAQTIGTSAGNMELAVAGTSEVTLTSTNFQPTTNDGNALGVSGTAWSDIFLASGSIIDFAGGDVTITHATDRLTFGGSVVNLLVNATPDDLYGNVMSLFTVANYVSQYTQSNSLSSAYWTGFYSEPENTSTNPGASKYMVGFVAAPETSATSGTLGGLYGFIVRGAVQGAGGTATNLVGYAMENGITTGTITNQYGIKLNRLSAGSTLNRGYHQDLQTTGTMIQLSADSAVTLDGTALTGMNIDFNASVTAATDVDVTGYALLTPALTQSAANTTNFRGYNLATAGALIQDTAAGTLDWRGVNIQMPNITQTTGTVNSYGVYVNGGTVTSGTQYAVFVDSGLIRADGGIVFGTGAGVSTLSNYEENTFTPTVTLVGGAGNTVPVYVTNTGRYTRIGRQVFVEVYLTGDGGAEGAGTGTFSVALPLTASASNPTSYFPVGFFANGTAEDPIWGQIVASGTVIDFAYEDVLNNFAVMTGAEQNNVTRTVRLKFAYEV